MLMLTDISEQSCQQSTYLLTKHGNNDSDYLGKHIYVKLIQNEAVSVSKDCFAKSIYN